MRFSKILAEKYNISVRTAKKYLKDGFVTHDESITKKDEEYSCGELILNITPSSTEYELDSYLIADFGNIVYFDKPVNMHSERQKPTDKLTISDIVEQYYPEHRLISRLDFTTDGIIAAVKNGYEPKTINKTYMAVVSGIVEKTFSADFLIDAANRKLVKISNEHGGNMTVFTPIEYRGNYTLIRAEFSQASRHQLRAYLAHSGYPILGDTAYGGHDFHRIMLHSHMIIIDDRTGISKLKLSF